MTSQLRPDEEFVIRALAAHVHGMWTPGEDPPDAYMKMGEETVAIEISTLAQQVVDERGGMKPRLSEDTAALRLADELNDELLSEVPEGRMVVLSLRAPILELRRTKERLKKRILSLVADGTNRTIDVEENILGNRIGINLSTYDGTDPRKVHAAVVNQKSDAHISRNARLILEDRIVTKTKKCSALPFNGRVWLVLLNDYFLASDRTYREALAEITHPHLFDRIFLVAGDGAVTLLYERPRIEISRPTPI
jgi:hypothetical protein